MCGISCPLDGHEKRADIDRGNHRILVRKSTRRVRIMHHGLKTGISILPHAEFYSEEAIRNIRLKAALVIKNFFAGDKLKNVINKNFLPEEIRKNLL